MDLVNNKFSQIANNNLHSNQFFLTQLKTIWIVRHKAYLLNKELIYYKIVSLSNSLQITTYKIPNNITSSFNPNRRKRMTKSISQVSKNKTKIAVEMMMTMMIMMKKMMNKVVTIKLKTKINNTSKSNNNNNNNMERRSNSWQS